MSKESRNKVRATAGGVRGSSAIDSLAASGVPVVVIVGRANAGKSTLFNRIVGRRTRDRESDCRHHARPQYCPGLAQRTRICPWSIAAVWSFTRENRRPNGPWKKRLHAVASAEVVVFVVDGHAGISSGDEEALALIRETGRPMVLAVNKVDHPGRANAAASDAYTLGVPNVVFVSAAHGHGLEELLDAIVATLPQQQITSEVKPDLRLALIGRPNVGKSSILNRLSGYERAIVDDRPGTTRDPVDVRVKAGDREVLLIDTAGIRRPTKVEGELEGSAVGRAIQTIRRAEVLALVIDATEGITDQDTRLARLVDHEGRALILVCNKWDEAAKQGRRMQVFVRDQRADHPFLDFAPMLFTSALTGDGIKEIIPSAATSRSGVACVIPDGVAESHTCRRDGGNGSAAGGTAAAEADVCDANRHCAAATRVLCKCRARHSRALCQVSRKAISQGTRPRICRHSPAYGVPADGTVMGGRAR